MNLLCSLFGHKMLYAEPDNMASGGRCSRKFCKYERSPIVIPPPPWRIAHPEPPTEKPQGPAPDPSPIPRSLLKKLIDLDQFVAAIRIGEWTITRTDDGKIWISDEAGEGGEFDEQKLAEAIEAFYMENF